MRLSTAGEIEVLLASSYNTLMIAEFVKRVQNITLQGFGI